MVLLGAQLTGAGLSWSLGPSQGTPQISAGWLGPPDPNDTPEKQSDIVNFITGPDVVAGGGFKVDTWGAGFTAVSSLSGTYPGGERLQFQPLAGEEIALTGGSSVGLDISGGLSCAARLPDYGGAISSWANSAWTTLTHQMWGQLSQDIIKFPYLAGKEGIDLVKLFYNVMKTCATGQPS